MAEPYDMYIENADTHLAEHEVKSLGSMLRSPEWQLWQKIVDGVKRQGADGVLLDPKVNKVELMFRQQGAWLFERTLDDTAFGIVEQYSELQKRDEAKKKS